MKELFSGSMVEPFCETPISITTGTSAGSPYTWAWLWGKDDWYWMGYRLDRDKRGYFLSLRQYRAYKKSLVRDEIYSEKCEMFRMVRKTVSELLQDGTLVYELGGNNAGYQESEWVRFYFHENDRFMLKKQLRPLAEAVIRAYCDSYDIDRLK